MNVFLIIVASGKGTRSGLELPKQFLKIKGKTLLEHTMECFSSTKNFKKIVITLPQGFMSSTNNDNISLKERLIEKDMLLIEGGEKRFDSAFNALKYLDDYTDEKDFVFIHDGARPFVSRSLLNSLFSEIPHNSGVIPVIPITDTVKEVNNDFVVKTADRSILKKAQTPQVFKFNEIYKAYLLAKNDDFCGTDDASIFENSGYKVKTIQGCSKNIKITTPDDLDIFKEKLKKTRVGFGSDTHRFEKGRDLILCGEKIPYTHGLLGHSDADAPLHAIIDALLGAAGLGDIGEHFPDTSMRYKNISSLDLLKRVHALITEKGYEIINIDLTITLEKPKISKYKEKMKENISSVLEIKKDCINIKATTTEGLGFEGEGLGLSAQAVILIE